MNPGRNGIDTTVITRENTLNFRCLIAVPWMRAIRTPDTNGIMTDLRRCVLTRRREAVLAALAVLAAIFGTSSNLAHGDLPANVGYLRVNAVKSSHLIIFDADTFETYRRVKFPPSYTAHSHRLEMDPLGRIWIGYTEPCRGLMGCWLRDQRKGVSVFSPEGDIVHDLRICQPEGGVAFANGYAFVGCWTKVYVVDTDTLAVVARIEWEYPPGAKQTAPYWGMTAIEEIDGSILIFVRSSSSVTSIGVIDPRTLTIRGYQNGLEPGLRISDAVEVDGKAWVFNELSHIKERPPRVDVYVVHPRTLNILDHFNLDNPYPRWARRNADGSIHIFHQASGERSRRAGFRSGITRLDPATRSQQFVATPDHLSADGLDVYRGQTCLAEAQGEDIGLWCMNDDGTLELRIPQEEATGVLFGQPVP